MRLEVWKRDRGICAECGEDTKRVQQELAFAERAGKGASFRKENGIPKHRKTLWDADHIIPVERGGGSCGLENIRTLCLSCHTLATSKEATERAARKRGE